MTAPNPNNTPYSFGSSSSGTPWNTGYDPNAGAVPGGAGGINTNNGLAPGTVSGPSTAPTLSAPSQNQGVITTSGGQPAVTGLQPGNGAGINGVDLTQPGMGENVSNAYLSAYAQNGTPTTSNNAQQAYTDFRNSQPANMDPYYNNAQRLSDNAINTQMAARGSYGSSNAIGVLSNADTNLRAQQAKDEAQYGLQRYGLQGQLASGSDVSSLNQSNNERDWMNGLTDIGFKNQRESTARGQLGFEDQLKGAGVISGIEGQVGGAEIANDEALLEKLRAADSGATADQVTAAQNALALAQKNSSESTASNTGAIQTTGGALASYV